MLPPFGISMLSVQSAPPAAGTFQWMCALSDLLHMSPDHDIAAARSPFASDGA